MRLSLEEKKLVLTALKFSMTDGMWLPFKADEWDVRVKPLLKKLKKEWGVKK